MDADLKPIDTRIVRRASDKENKHMTNDLIAQKNEKTEVNLGNFGKFSNITLVGDWPMVNQTDMRMGGARPRYLHQLKGTKITFEFQHTHSEIQTPSERSKRINKIRRQPAHKLSEKEIDAYRTSKKEFVDITAETAKLGEVMALKTYYNWKKAGKKELVVFVDPSDSLTDGYTIYFKGPTADFDKHLATIEKSLKTIR